MLALVTGASASPEQTVVVANRNVPASLELAGHYLKARGIPDQQLCLVDLPDAEHISRDVFEKNLRQPLLEWLEVHQWIDRGDKQADGDDSGEFPIVGSRLKYLVSMYGIPLRVVDTDTIGEKIEQAMQRGNKDTAAVDSELAVLLHAQRPPNGLRVNPLYRAELWPPIQGHPQQSILVAARLDGPTPEVVRGMIDDAVEREAYGLNGRAYFDLRSIRERGYVLGEIWMEESYQRLLREGYDCVVNRDPALWRESYPMADVAFYMGWYAEHVVGPFTRESFRFAPGGIGYHLHSGSASTLRSDSKHWVGPLLSRGAVATMGTVHEPFLVYTPQLDIFTHRLCNGLSFGESVYLASNALSWQTTVVGDPLYRPFRFNLDQQIARMEQDKRPEVEWGYLRKVNLMARRGQLNLALDYCRDRIEATGSLLLREKLADLYAVNHLYEFAAEEYGIVVNQSANPEQTIRAAGRLVWLLDSLQKTDAAADLRQQVRENLGQSEMLPWFEKIGNSAGAP